MYKKNRHIVETTNVGDTNLIQYIRKAIEKKLVSKKDGDHLIKIINNWKDEKLHEVLETIMKEYDKYCCLFNYIQGKIYDELRLQSFFGFSFYLDI